MHEDTREPSLTRRQALTLLGAAGTLSLVGAGRRAGAQICTTMPAETEGPYFVDELLERSDIRVDPSDGSVSAGVPLRLHVNVLRPDADCASAAGVQVDIWHCDALGRYSDEAANATVGKKFLRGYQITDASGGVDFTTVFPGWYSGRTVHIHLKARTTDGFEFTSQLYFDDAVADQVLASAPYDSRGTRDTTNATDGIFGNATSLLVPLTADRNGGYTGTFDAGITGLPATTTGSGGGACGNLGACRAALAAALPDPDPSEATSRKARHVARRLAKLQRRVADVLTRAATASAGRQSRLYRRARTALGTLLTVADAAASRGTLGVAVAPIASAVNALLVLIPSA